MAYIAMAYVGMPYVAMAYRAMALIDEAYIATTRRYMVYIVIAIKVRRSLQVDVSASLQMCVRT